MPGECSGYPDTLTEAVCSRGGRIGLHCHETQGEEVDHQNLIAQERMVGVSVAVHALAYGHADGDTTRKGAMRGPAAAPTRG